ncbi:MAG: hypothetical protein ACRED1_04975, partial [Limisphaerales bacterium]
MTDTASQRASPGRRAWMRFKRNRPGMVSAWYLALLVAVVIAWPLILNVAPARFARLHDPEQLSNAQFVAPDARHWFGTDLLG